MKDIFDLIVTKATKDMNDPLLEKNLQIKINKYVDMYKFSQAFIKEFMSMYDTEQLYGILVCIQKELHKRAIDDINNTGVRV
jgi:hypothetical protein